MTAARAATVLRTVGALHPLQVLARPYAVFARRALRDVPAIAAPALRQGWPRAPEALRAYANAERARGAERIARLPAGALRDYERVYGLEIGGDDGPLGDWSPRVAIAAFPASVRARRLAVGAWLGRAIPAGELARAARAVAVQPEVHLLGNHLLENGFGLACAGAAAVGVEADAWWRLGCAILAWQLPRQLMADGGHFERSASYHVALAAALVETIAIADASRGAPPLWRDFARRACAWALAVRAPDGAYPLFNDAALDAAPTIDALLALARACGIRVDAEAHDAISVARLEPTGWLTMTAADAWLVADAGPDGARDQPGHAHADGLAFELWIGGRRTVVDYGVASYASDDARAATRATRAHNTVEYDGRDSCEVWGAFRLGRRGRGAVLGADAHADRATAELAHDGYAWLPGAPRHRRMLTLREGSLTIRDRVAGGRAPFVSRLRLDEEAARGVRVTHDGARAIPRHDVWFPRHGDARPALVYEAAARGEAEVTLLVEW